MLGLQPVQARADRVRRCDEVVKLKNGHGECHDVVPTRGGKHGRVRDTVSSGSRRQG